MSIVKITAAFAAGVAAGCVGTYLYMKKYVVEPEYIDIVPEEEEIEAEPELDPEPMLSEEELKTVKLYPNISDAVTPEEKEDEIIDETPEVKEDKASVTYPYEISMEQYLNDKLDYEKIVCQLYIEDETLVADEVMEGSEDGELMDYHDTVGDELFSKFVNANEDLQYMWVRNDALSTDYEICRNEASYKRLMGLEE